MLKYRGYIDQHPQSDREQFERDRIRYTAYSIPTVDEIEDTISFMTADTILQILHGQGIYWGPRHSPKEKEIDNRVYTRRNKNLYSDIIVDTRPRNMWIKIPKKNKWRDMKIKMEGK